MVLYAGQGIPYGLLVIALPAYLARRGLTPAQSGAYLGLILLPWSMKLAVGPLMDRYQFPAMGRRRPWIIGAQAAIVASLAGAALISDPMRMFSWLIAAGFCINLSTVFQDVAVDSLAIDLAPEGEQGVINGFMTGGRTLGLAASTAVAGWGLTAIGLPTTALLLASLQVLILSVTLSFRERPGERLLPWTEGQGAPDGGEANPGFAYIARRLWRVFVLPASLWTAAAIFAFNMAKGFVVAMLPLLTVQQLGWTESQYPELMASAGLVTGMLGLVLVGPLVDRAGRLVVMGGAFVGLGLACVALGSAPGMWAVSWPIPVFVCLFLLAEVCVSVSFFATAMVLCDTRIAATQYAVYMAVSNFGMSVGAVLFSAADGWLTFPRLFVVAGVLLVATALSLLRVDLGAHKDTKAALVSSEVS